MMMRLTAKSKNGEDHGYPTTTHRFKPNNRFLPLEETIEHWNEAEKCWSGRYMP